MTKLDMNLCEDTCYLYLSHIIKYSYVHWNNTNVFNYEGLDDFPKLLLSGIKNITT